MRATRGLFQQPLCHGQALDNSREIGCLSARKSALSGRIIRKTPPCRPENSRQNPAAKKNRGDPRSPLCCGRKVRGRGGLEHGLCCLADATRKTCRAGYGAFAAAPHPPTAILKTRFMAGIDSTTASAKLASSAIFLAARELAACFPFGKSNWDASSASPAARLTVGQEKQPRAAVMSQPCG